MPETLSSKENPRARGRSAGRRWPKRLALVFGLVGLAVLGTYLFFARQDAEHARFFQAGTSINAFLADYCRGLKQAGDEEDLSALLAYYAPSYSSPSRGSWRWGAPRDVGGAQVQTLLVETTPAVTREGVEDELAAYLAAFDAIESA